MVASQSIAGVSQGSTFASSSATTWAASIAMRSNQRVVAIPGARLPAASDTVTLAIEPAPGKAEQALRQEDDHDDDDHAERDKIGELIAENARQQLAKELEEPGADDGADQRADAAHDVEDDGVARCGEEYEFRCGELVLHGVEHAGKPGEQAGQHDRHKI